MLPAACAVLCAHTMAICRHSAMSASELAATSLQQCWRWRAGKFPKLSNQSKFEIDDALLTFLHTNREHLFMYLTKQSVDALTESTHTLLSLVCTRPLPARPPPLIPSHPTVLSAAPCAPTRSS